MGRNRTAKRRGGYLRRQSFWNQVIDILRTLIITDCPKSGKICGCHDDYQVNRIGNIDQC